MNTRVAASIPIASRNGERTLPDMLRTFEKARPPVTGTWDLMAVGSSSDDRMREVLRA